MPSSVIAIYSVQCTYLEASNRHERGRLIGGGPNPNGYTFVYCPNIWSNVPALEAFRRALGEWRCASGVNIVEMCRTHDICKDNIAKMPGLLRVDFASSCFSMDEAAEAQTQNNLITVKTGNDTLFMNRNAAIVFKDLPSWNYNGTANPNLGEKNFEHYALHELGHFQLLRHVNDPIIMATANYNTSEVGSIINLGNDPAITGANKVVDFSTTTPATYYPPWLKCCPPSVP